MQDIYEKKHEWKVDTLSDISLKASSSCQPLGKPFIFTKESCFGIGAGRLFYKKWKKNKQEIWRMRIGKFNDAMIAIDTSISTLTEVLYWEKHHLCLSSSSIWFNFDWKTLKFIDVWCIWNMKNNNIGIASYKVS